MRRLSLALLAAGVITLAYGTAARADNDTVRLGKSSTGAASDITGDVDTSLVVWRGGYHGHRGYYGGYRGYYGGYRGYYGGYRGGYWGGGYGFYRRPYYGGYYGGYRPYYAGYYGGGFYGAGYYRPYYGGYYGYSSYYWPCSAQSAPVVVTLAPQAVQPAAPVYQAQAPAPQLLPAPAPVAAPQQATYPYDGGPKALVPMPNADTVDPTFGPRPTVPVQGKLVYLPAETTGGSTQLHTVSLQTSVAQQPAAAPRYSYPAYGEQSLPPVTRRHTN